MKLLRGRNRGNTGQIDSFDKGTEWINNGDWKAPDEWIDISHPPANEIYMLATDGGVQFQCGISSGTYSVDWGDGNTSLNIGNLFLASHQYNGSGGKYCTNLGYWIYKIRVWTTSTFVYFSTSNTGTYFTNTLGQQAILSFVTKITTLNNCANMFNNCYMLQNVEITSIINSTSNASMFSNCYSLKRFNCQFTLGSVTSISSMFSNCKSITMLKLPILPNTLGTGGIHQCLAYTNINIAPFTTFGSSYGTITNLYGNTLIETINIPQLPSGGNITSWFANCSVLRNAIIQLWNTNNGNRSYFFVNCINLKTAILPTNKVTTASNNIDGFFQYCSSLTYIENLDNLGNDNYDTSAADLFNNCFSLTGVITINFRLSRFGCTGANATSGKLKITGLRLTNANSGFGGSSPQINCSYCDFSATALNTLFGDLPTLTGKTINITGCTGAASCDRTIATNKGWTVTG